MAYFTDRKTLIDGTGSHAYACTVGKEREEGVVEVHASNRNQAVRRVERLGHYVRDCNMIG